ANLIGIVAIFAATTLMIDLANALTLLKVPPRIASTVSLAFASAPIFAAQLGEIIDAYQSRGFKVYYLNPFRRIRAFLALLPPTRRFPPETSSAISSCIDPTTSVAGSPARTGPRGRR